MLSIKNLRIGYPHARSQHILFDKLNLHLKAGELVCFMGPNGIGKSSLIRTLAGLQEELAGSIEIIQPHEKKSEIISVVLTDKITASNMSVYDLVAFGRYPYLSWNIQLTATDREVIDRAIGQVQIDHLRDQKLAELSDGQLQMAMIARAFAQDTPIILLDEPTAHLDLNNRVEIMKLLRSLARSTRKSILISTHELDLALQMADTIWLAGRHRNILTGLPEDLVLQGAFDAIFQFKGFDLKTGKVQHDVVRSEVVYINGAGPEYWWTKNAFERMGFIVSPEKQNTEIVVINTGGNVRWELKTRASVKQFESLEALLKYL